MDIEEFVDVDAIKKWWLELTRRYYALQKQIEPLREERLKIEDVRGRLVRVLEAVGIGTGEIDQMEAAIREELEAGPRAEPAKLSDAAYEVLASLGEPTHYRVLLDAIRERGIQVPGTDPGTNLIAHMLKNERFSKAPEVGKGYYKLKEWEQEA